MSDFRHTVSDPLEDVVEPLHASMSSSSSFDFSLDHAKHKVSPHFNFLTLLSSFSSTLPGAYCFPVIQLCPWWICLCIASSSSLSASFNTSTILRTLLASQLVFRAGQKRVQLSPAPTLPCGHITCEAVKFCVESHIFDDFEIIIDLQVPYLNNTHSVKRHIFKVHYKTYKFYAQRK